VTPVAGNLIEGIVPGLFKLGAQMVAKLKSVLAPQRRDALKTSQVKIPDHQSMTNRAVSGKF